MWIAAFALALIYAAYNLGGGLVLAKQAGIPFTLTSVKARECESAPSSRCFAELAVLSLPPRAQFEEFDQTGRMLRYLGYGALVDARAKDSDNSDMRQQRRVQRIYANVADDYAAFSAAPPISDPSAYAFAFYRLQDDIPIGGGGDGDIMRAEEAALERRGAAHRTNQSLALLKKWRESLDLYEDSGLTWLWYAARARELGETNEAKFALARAVELGVYRIQDLTVIFETLYLYGREMAYRRIETYPDTNFRASAYLALATHALTLKDVNWAADAFGRFGDNYDAAEPVRHRAQWARMARKAALVAYRLGDDEKTHFWAKEYVNRISYQSRSVRALDAGELYARIGARTEAIAFANEGIVHATPPDESFGAPWLGFPMQSTTPIHMAEVGRGIGLLCRAGDFGAVSSLARKDAGYGPSASPGCVVAIQNADDPLLALSRFEDMLGSLAQRSLRTLFAAHLVESGSYEQAARIIERSVALPSEFDDVSRVHGNVELLRLAVAMRNKPLTKRIMQAIASDAASVADDRSARTFATVATITRKWPGEDLSEGSASSR